MYLLQSWKESFEFLKSKNLKLLFLVALRMIRDNYKFFIPIVLFSLCERSLLRLTFGDNFQFLGMMQKILLGEFFFISVLIVRSSVKKKNMRYFLDYTWHFIFWTITLFGIGLYLNRFFIFSVGVFWILFWLDSRFGIKNFLFSLWRAIKMFVYNFPFYLAVSFLVIISFLGLMIVVTPISLIFHYVKLAYLFRPVLNLLLEFAYIALLIFYTCLFTAFYTKRVHDQFKLYYKE